MESFHTKPDSLPTSPSARDEPKEAIINLPLIPIIKIKTEIHPRTKLTDGENRIPCNLPDNLPTHRHIPGSKSGYSTSFKDEDASSMFETPSSPLDLKEMERSFELEI
jgi:hypothetical protein